MSKAFTKSLFLFYKFLVRRLKAIHATTTTGGTPPAANVKPPQRRMPPPPPSPPPGEVSLCAVEGGLLLSPSTFPYFMLVALEGGGLLRGLLLLLLYPVLCVLSREAGLRVMVMVCFLGLRKERFRLGQAVMPKVLLGDACMEVFDAVRRSRRRVCLSGMPKVMVEAALREYLKVDVVVAPELKEFRGYYLGIMEAEREVVERLDVEAVVGGEGAGGAVGIGGAFGRRSCFHQLFRHCKEVYVPSSADRQQWRRLRSSEYPKPVIFHDGRIAFYPSALNTLCMFLWLPLGSPLSVTRAAVFLLLPYHASIPLLAVLGMYSRIVDTPPPLPAHSSGHLYVCNHRTLLDPLYISCALDCDLTAVTYSISRLSEVLSPIRTIPLTRNRDVDKRAMEAVLAQGNLVVCPEGTTCREPFLLRFSALFAELGRTVVPVALRSAVTMFYPTTAGGRKFLDPFYFLMNPTPFYRLQFLEAVETDGCTGGAAARDLANCLQRRIADALGFQCTSLTRRDKYLILAGNEGIVEDRKKQREE